MIILEIQHNGDGTTSVLNEVIADRNAAEQTYRTKLSYAAVSPCTNTPWSCWTMLA